MDLVHEGGPWTRSKEGVHGPGVHVLSSPVPRILVNLHPDKTLLKKSKLTLHLINGAKSNASLN